MHQWSFSSVNQSANVLVVAVCGTCGVIRAQNAPGPAHERHIDLRGACSGSPQEPEGKQVAKKTEPPEPPEPFVAFGS